MEAHRLREVWGSQVIADLDAAVREAVTLAELCQLARVGREGLAAELAALARLGGAEAADDVTQPSEPWEPWDATPCGVCRLYGCHESKHPEPCEWCGLRSCVCRHEDLYPFDFDSRGDL